MKAFLISKFGRRVQVLAVLLLATVALLLLLGAWSGLPAAEARGPAAASLGDSDLLLSSSNAITIYLPIVFKSDLVFFDNFNDSSSGWPHEVSYEDCYFEYYNGRYRVKVSEQQECPPIPNLKIPKQVNGTFKVKVRRTSDEDGHMYYGLIFGAGVNAFEDRWALKVYPNNDPPCDNKPYFWLIAHEDGDQEFFEDVCTNTIDTDKNDWNELKIIRNGKDIKVYTNGYFKLHVEGDDAAHLLDEGYTLLYVASVSNETIYVEFDDFEIRRSITP
jgi:hypothetical protein